MGQVWLLQVAQETPPGWMDKDVCEEGSVPGSPKSDSEWELLPDATVPSDCGSSAKYAKHTMLQHNKVNCVVVVAYHILCACRSVCIDCTSDSVCSSVETTGVTPHLHVKLTPQGGSDVSLQLTLQDQDAACLSNNTLQEQQDYQDQLHKAQQTLLHQVMVCSNTFGLDANKTCLC